MNIRCTGFDPDEAVIYGSYFTDVPSFPDLDFPDKNFNKEFEQISLWNILGIDEYKKTPTQIMPEIKDVWYRKPATIVWWEDGTKTVVKCQYTKGDRYDKEKGLAMAIIKKMYGNNGDFNDIFRKWGCWDE